jgi:hypothetical protein
MSTKRTSLESLKLTPRSSTREAPSQDAEPPRGDPRKRPAVRQQTVYLPVPVYEQLRRLAFEERAKMHDFLMQGLDLVFKTKGLKSIAELKGEP